MRHPLHPALVHFPIACWVLVLPCDIAKLVISWSSIDPVAWGRVECLSALLLIVGLILALPAMLAGLMDLNKVQGNTPALKVANYHMLLMCSAWAIYLISLLLRIDGLSITNEPGLAAILIAMLGFITLLVGGWYGGELVYRYRIGVDAC